MNNFEYYKKDIYYLMFIYCDFLFLRDIFQRHFSLSCEFKIEEIICSNDIHPDFQIACKIKESNDKTLQQYIGVSQLCCVFCSLFIDSIGLDFRGVAKKYEKKWNLEPTIDIDIDSFKKQLKNFNEMILKTEPVYEISFLRCRWDDQCQHAYVTISDDLCLFLEYYNRNEFSDLKFFIKDLNDKNVLFNFLKNLRKKFKCITHF